MSVAERREREREARRDHILDAAQRVFYEKGLDAANMDDVARAAQLGKGTLYLYFQDKEDLVLGVALRRQRALLRAFEPHLSEPPLTRLRRLFAIYVEHLRTPDEHLRMVMLRWAGCRGFDDERSNAEPMRDKIRHTYGIFCEAIEEGQRDGSIRADLPAQRLTLQLWSSVNGWLLMQLQLPLMPSELKQAVPDFDEQLELLLDAIQTPAPRESLTRGGAA